MQSAIFYESSWTGNQKPEGYELVAAIDESESYEVDITEVYRTATGYAIVTASGCSCWDGDYEANEFATLDEVIATLRLNDREGFVYNPSQRGAQELIAQLEALA